MSMNMKFNGRSVEDRNDNFNAGDPRIVVIGGGSGSSHLLRGLKQYTANITAIVTMFDSGGSSGLLRHEFGYPPFGDLRQCLLALSRESEPAQSLEPVLDFRFEKESSLRGHNLGNLLLAALTSLSGLEEAIERLSEVLQIQGQVLPVSLDQADLCAELQDRTVLKGETNIDLRGCSAPKIERVFLKPRAKANPHAVQAILDADAIVIGPGDLYTSVIPNLLVSDIPQALQQTSAPLIHVCNLMTKLGETDDFPASQFVCEINRYLEGRIVDWALVNTAPIPQEIQERYVIEGAKPVEADLDRLTQQEVKYLGSPFADNSTPVRHNSVMLAQAILSLLHYNRIIETSPEFRQINSYSQ